MFDPPPPPLSGVQGMEVSTKPLTKESSLEKKVRNFILRV